MSLADVNAIYENFL